MEEATEKQSMADGVTPQQQLAAVAPEQQQFTAVAPKQQQQTTEDVAPTPQPPTVDVQQQPSVDVAPTPQPPMVGVAPEQLPLTVGVTLEQTPTDTVGDTLDQQQQQVAAVALEQQQQQVAAIALEQQQQLAAVALEQQQQLAAVALEQQQQAAAIALDQQQQAAAIALEQQKQQSAAIALEQLKQQSAAVTLDQQKQQSAAVTLDPHKQQSAAVTLDPQQPTTAALMLAHPQSDQQDELVAATSQPLNKDLIMFSPLLPSTEPPKSPVLSDHRNSDIFVLSPSLLQADPNQQFKVNKRVQLFDQGRFWSGKVVNIVDGANSSDGRDRYYLKFDRLPKEFSEVGFLPEQMRPPVTKRRLLGLEAGITVSLLDALIPGVNVISLASRTHDCFTIQCVDMFNRKLVVSIDGTNTTVLYEEVSGIFEEPDATDGEGANADDVDWGEASDDQDDDDEAAEAESVTGNSEMADPNSDTPISQRKPRRSTAATKPVAVGAVKRNAQSPLVDPEKKHPKRSASPVVAKDTAKPQVSSISQADLAALQARLEAQFQTQMSKVVSPLLQKMNQLGSVLAKMERVPSELASMRKTVNALEQGQRATFGSGFSMPNSPLLTRSALEFQMGELKGLIANDPSRNSMSPPVVRISQQLSELTRMLQQQQQSSQALQFGNAPMPIDQPSQPSQLNQPSQLFQPPSYVPFQSPYEPKHNSASTMISPLMDYSNGEFFELGNGNSVPMHSYVPLPQSIAGSQAVVAAAEPLYGEMASRGEVGGAVASGADLANNPKKKAKKEVIQKINHSFRVPFVRPKTPMTRYQAEEVCKQQVPMLVKELEGAYPTLHRFQMAHCLLIRLLQATHSDDCLIGLVRGISKKHNSVVAALAEMPALTSTVFRFIFSAIQMDLNNADGDNLTLMKSLIDHLQRYCRNRKFK